MERLNELLIKQKVLEDTLRNIKLKLEEQAQEKTKIELHYKNLSNQLEVGVRSTGQIKEANMQIRRMISLIPESIPLRLEGQAWGFVNLKSMLLHYGISIFMAGLVCCIITNSKDEEINRLLDFRSKAQNFIAWIQLKQPETWEKWKSK